LHWRYVGGQNNEFHLQPGLRVINLSAILIFIFCNFIQHWLSAGGFQIQPHRQWGTLCATLLQTSR
jgi:hypothetical protein